MSKETQDAPGQGKGVDRGESTGPTIRLDGAAEPTAVAGESVGRARRWKRLERAWWLALVVTMGVFSALPVVNMALGLSTKDYELWIGVGRAEWLGRDVYPRPETGRLFPFMYPPSAAAMLGFLSPLGPTGMLIALVAVNSLSWIACIALSARLAAGPGGRRHPLVAIVPTLSVIVLIHNIYLLGQPNLMLLALMLGAFACLAAGREVAAGALIATAAAIKAFPILALGYLVYRRMWRASAATVAVLAAWLLIAPLAFRTPSQAVDDLSVWARGMLFTYDEHGIAQRPLRSYSYKNQSIMAVMHRLLRDVPADGESIVSGRSHGAPGAVRPPKGLPGVDPSNDPLSFLKPHPRGEAPGAGASEATAEGPGPRWEEDIRRAEPAFRSAWKVNVLSLDFRAVTAVVLATMLGLSLFVAAAMPPRTRRTRETDALEYALVTLLTVMFSPLSFNYAYVWLMYPTALALHRVLGDPSDPSPRPRGWLARSWMAAVLLIPASAVAAPQAAQACGNLFVPALLLVLGLGAILWAEGRRPRSAGGTPAQAPHQARGPIATAGVVEGA